MSPETYIHFNPERVDYTVSDTELVQLTEPTSLIWKEILLFALPTLVSCGLNAFELAPTPSTPPSMAFILNTLFAVVALAASVLGGIQTYRHSGRATRVLSAIKNKPRFQVSATNSTLNANQVIALQSTQSFTGTIK